MSVKTVSPQNGGFTRATEIARRLFVGKAKPFFCFEIDTNLPSSQRNLLDNFFLLNNLCKKLLDNSIVYKYKIKSKTFSVHKL